jgi:hypothetical protein
MIKKLLLVLTLICMPTQVFSAAVIFSGTKVRALRQILNLNNIAEVHSGSVDPSAGGGVAAPAGSIYLRTTGVIYIKQSATATDWAALSTGAGSGAAAVRFDLNGPFNTTFERIDGMHICDATVTYTTARSFVYYNGTAGSLTAQIWLNNASTGASGDITVGFSVTPSVDNETISVTCNAGDYIWVDITGLPTGTVEDFSVVLYE